MLVVIAHSRLEFLVCMVRTTGVPVHHEASVGGIVGEVGR